MEATTNENKLQKSLVSSKSWEKIWVETKFNVLWLYEHLNWRWKDKVFKLSLINLVKNMLPDECVGYLCLGKGLSNWTVTSIWVI